MDVWLSKQIKMFAREHGDQSHVSFAEGTYEDTVVVQSPYEGVLLEMIDRLDDEGIFVYYDSNDNAISEIEYDEDPDRPQQVSAVPRFEITVCQHNAHPNYS